MTSFLHCARIRQFRVFGIIRGRDFRADFLQNFRETGGINSKTGVLENFILTSFKNLAVEPSPMR